MKNKVLGLSLLVLLSACGGSSKWVDEPTDGGPNDKPADIDTVDADGFIPRARAIIHLSSDKDSLASKLFGISKAYAATTTVTYTVSPSATFTVNTSALLAGSMTGDTLSFGSATVTALNDNNLKICGVSNNQKCTQSIVRIYTTTETVAGLVHDVDDYGLPVYADKTATPTTSVGLGSANAAIVQTFTIPGNKNRVRLSNFPTPTYNITADLENAGAGSYSMTLVIEYAVGL